MKRTGRAERRALVREARKVLAASAAWADGPGGCLLQAWAVCAAGARLGRPLKLFAGSAMWPYQTHPEVVQFGYEWTGPVRPAGGSLPEMHCWAGDPYTCEIIDISTGNWPEQCRRLVGEPWTAPRPPEAFFGRLDALPPFVEYRATREAGLYAVTVLRELCHETP